MNAKFVFYGIGRGLVVSQPSIEKQLIEKSKKYFNKVSILHLIQIEENISNERSGDFGKITKFEGNTFDKQKPIFVNYNPKKQSPELFKKIKNSKCMHGDNHKSSFNLLKQINLLNNKNIKINNDEIIIFCRDDIRIEFFNEKIFEYAKKLNHDEFIVSCYDWQNGINDRFFISKGKVANLLKSRIKLIDNLIKLDKGINGERLMKLAASINKLKPAAYNIKFSRVRLNESIVKEKRYLPPHRPFEIMRILLAFITNLYIKYR